MGSATRHPHVAVTLPGEYTMKNIRLFPAILLPILLLMPGMASAQQASERCPALPASSGLHWEERANTGFLACKARAADNGMSMNLLLTSRDPDLRLSRSRREEPGVFSGRTLHWYVPELAGQDEATASSKRIAVVELGKDQYAQIWLDATSPEALAELQALAAKLDISAGAAYLVSGH
jgi:hypothetical protein